MINYFIGLVLAVFAMTSQAHSLEVIRVVDGDTIQVTTPIVGVPELGKTILIRVVGIDTPESTFRAKCDKERLAGLAAKNFLMSMTKAGSIVDVRIVGWDKYGGRVLGVVNSNGSDVATTMVSRGFAKPYDGGTKGDWCTK